MFHETRQYLCTDREETYERESQTIKIPIRYLLRVLRPRGHTLYISHAFISAPCDLQNNPAFDTFTPVYINNNNFSIPHSNKPNEPRKRTHSELLKLSRISLRIRQNRIINKTTYIFAVEQFYHGRQDMILSAGSSYRPIAPQIFH